MRSSLHWKNSFHTISLSKVHTTIFLLFPTNGAIHFVSSWPNHPNATKIYLQSFLNEHLPPFTVRRTHLSPHHLFQTSSVIKKYYEKPPNWNTPYSNFCNDHTISRRVRHLWLSLQTSADNIFSQPFFPNIELFPPTPYFSRHKTPYPCIYPFFTKPNIISASPSDCAIALDSYCARSANLWSHPLRYRFAMYLLQFLSLTVFTIPTYILPSFQHLSLKSPIQPILDVPSASSSEYISFFRLPLSVFVADPPELTLMHDMSLTFYMLSREKVSWAISFLETKAKWFYADASRNNSLPNQSKLHRVYLKAVNLS